MPKPDFRIRYDGGDASSHAVDMRFLGASLQGADKITSDGLIVLIYGRIPKRGERAPVLAKVREPQEGSYELWAFWESMKALLPLGLPKAADVAGYFIGEWWTATIAKFSGKKDIAEKAIEALVELQKEHLAARDASEERVHELLMAQQETIKQTLAMQARAIEQFVAPVGPSVHEAEILPTQGRRALLTNDDADAVRENLKLDWTPIHQAVLETDGFRFHTSGLSVRNPERDGWLMARVHDPQFDQEENVYTDAAQRRSAITVWARFGYKNGDLTAIEILEFVNEIPTGFGRGDFERF